MPVVDRGESTRFGEQSFLHLTCFHLVLGMILSSYHSMYYCTVVLRAEHNRQHIVVLNSSTFVQYTTGVYIILYSKVLHSAESVRNQCTTLHVCMYVVALLYGSTIVFYSPEVCSIVPYAAKYCTIYSTARSIVYLVVVYGRICNCTVRHDRHSKRYQISNVECG